MGRKLSKTLHEEGVRAVRIILGLFGLFMNKTLDQTGNSFIFSLGNSLENLSTKKMLKIH